MILSPYTNHISNNTKCGRLTCFACFQKYSSSFTHKIQKHKYTMCNAVATQREHMAQTEMVEM